MLVNARNAADTGFPQHPVGVNFRIFDILLVGSVQDVLGTGHARGGGGARVGGVVPGYGVWAGGADPGGGPWYGSGCMETTVFG